MTQCWLDVYSMLHSETCVLWSWAYPCSLLMAHRYQFCTWSVYRDDSSWILLELSSSHSSRGILCMSCWTEALGFLISVMILLLTLSSLPFHLPSPRDPPVTLQDPTLWIAPQKSPHLCGGNIKEISNDVFGDLNLQFRETFCLEMILSVMLSILTAVSTFN